MCEYQLGKRNLYPNISGYKTAKYSSDNKVDKKTQLKIIQNIISYADGSHTQLDISRILNIHLNQLKKMITILQKNRIIKI